MTDAALTASYPTPVNRVHDLMRGQFVGPVQAVSLGNSVVTQVKSSRSLGVEIDSDLNWNVHVKELIKSSSQKLNLLRSLYFLPIKARVIFYFKVILPSVTYGLVVWGSCGKSLFDELEKIHVHAAKMAWIDTHPAIRS